MTNAMVFTGTDSEGFACFADAATPAPVFTIPARVETDNIARKVANVAKGEYVRFVDTANAPVWIRGEYDRASREYSFCRFGDMNKERFLKGTKTVFVGFTF